MPPPARVRIGVSSCLLGRKVRHDGHDRAELQAIVGDYSKGLLPLVVPLTLLRHHLRRHPVEWLAGQVYLDPDPRELCLENHV